jgi:hypothetical protein
MYLRRGNQKQKFGVENRRKSCQILSDDIFLLCYLLIICGDGNTGAVLYFFDLFSCLHQRSLNYGSFRSLFNGSLDIMDHERDYATLDKSVRSPIGPVVPGTYMSTTEGSALVPELAAERNDASCNMFVTLPHILPMTRLI